MSALCCPHCGEALFLFDNSSSFDAAAGRKRQGEERSSEEAPDLPKTSFREGKWRIECPEHGWHMAKLWPASKGKPEVVKCTAFRDEATGEFCNTKVPAEVAKRRAGQAP